MNNRRLRILAIGLPVVFASLVLIWQVLNFSQHGARRTVASPVTTYYVGRELASVTNILDRDTVVDFLYQGPGRFLDLELPPDARIFMPGMIGTTNFWRRRQFYFLTYYVFPREVAVSLDRPAQETKDGFLGQTTDSDLEIKAHGFDARIDVETSRIGCRLLSIMPLRNPTTPAWFNGNRDTWIAFLLPLFTAFAGIWLLRLLFGALQNKMGWFEQLGCGLGLGMMVLAALTQAIKLCGFHGYHVIFLLAALGAVTEVIWHQKSYVGTIKNQLSKKNWNLWVVPVVLVGLVTFALLFRLSGLMGLVEYDAVMSWALKAKILHLCAGSELIQWFSNPRLAHAHLDYPMLVPSLHAATYDSLGHVNEYVTKFWPVWMWLFLLVALISSNQIVLKRRFPWPHLVWLTVLLLPATPEYVLREGATMPLTFFTVMGLVQCSLWLAEKDDARLALGFALLFGGALTKFEGSIFLALAAGWILLARAGRPPLRFWWRWWPVIAFCLLAALPFAVLRARMKVVNFESGWAGYALHNPGATLANWPGIFLMMLARLFVNKDFADWNIENGHFCWAGNWVGAPSLSDLFTLGMAWFCVAMAITLWFALPARRSVILWSVMMVLGATAAVSGIAAGFSNPPSAEHIVSLTETSRRYSIPLLNSSDRYLFPVFLAWFAILLTITFREVTVPSSSPSPAAPIPSRRRGPAHRQGVSR